MNFSIIDKKTILLYPFLFLLFSFTEVKSQNLTPPQFVEDLEFLKSELPKNHKNLFAKISETKFNSRITEIEQKSKSLNNESFEIELYKLIKEIDDEHTRIEPIYKTVYPLNFDFFEEGLFVTNTDIINSNLLYKRLNGIENSTLKELTENFKKIIKTDNQSYFDVYFQHFVNNPRILKGLYITQSDSIANFVLDNKKYELSSVKKENLSSKPVSNLLRFISNDNYWYKLIGNDKILYFNYQNCSEQEDKPFELFNNELFNLIEAKKPQKIIIDLRNNSGGNSAILNPFLEKLKKNYLNKKGSLYVLIGKNTFSSALMNAVDLKRNYKSILVGQTTSGNVNHYGETRGFRLPNSKIIVGYSTKYWEIWKGYNGALRPDIEIKYSLKNFKNNIDEAIEYVTNRK
jgi:hypothetical protein